MLIFVGIWAGFEAHFGSITPAYIASFTLITLPIIEGLVPVSNAVEKIPTFQESLNRIDSIRQFMPEPKSVHKSSVKPDSYMISIKNVTYRYERNQESVLKNISLSIPHRSKAAILGKSGAGKSTLLSLMVGAIEPTFGSVDLGGIRPHEIGDKIYDYIGVLNQKPYLFATTVENNIRLGKQDATDAEIEDVIQKVKLDEYIHSLPMGLKTQMQESGQRFSGGERQRIALARILLKNTPIVILDEPTVGLDPVTERDLLATIFATMHDKTLIIITHHLLGLEEMDQIVFLDDGHIVMSGSHHELIAKNDRYRQLYELDYGGVHF